MQIEGGLDVKRLAVVLRVAQLTVEFLRVVDLIGHRLIMRRLDERYFDWEVEDDDAMGLSLGQSDRDARVRAIDDGREGRFGRGPRIIVS